MVSTRLSLLVFTEDMGSDAHDTLAEIARKLLFLLEPGLDRDRVEFPPESPEARAGMGFNAYKSRVPRDEHKRVDLARAIARHLLTDDLLTAVIVHIDADRRWSDRDTEHGCDNLRCFHELILPRVRHILAAHHSAERLDRLIFLVPYWSIESWLYINCREALRICDATHPRYAAAVPHFTAWQSTPDILDEVERPKDLVAFGSRFNLRLAQSLPARRLHELGRSFAHAVETARSSALAGMLPALRHDAS